MEVSAAGKRFGHPMMAPPGTPADRVKILRNAYAKALRDPELIAEAQKGGSVIEPVSGEELQSLAERIMVQPPDVVNQLKKIRCLCGACMLAQRFRGGNAGRPTGSPAIRNCCVR